MGSIGPNYAESSGITIAQKIRWLHLEDTALTFTEAKHGKLETPEFFLESCNELLSQLIQGMTISQHLNTG